jgi:hypothetical protein
MSEKHPIDELFHHALHDAEVTPPTAVWEGIARARRKRRAGWLRWGALALLLTGTAGALLWQPWPQAPVAEVAAPANIKPAEPSAANMSSAAQTPVAPSSDTPSAAQEAATIQDEGAATARPSATKGPAPDTRPSAVLDRMSSTAPASGAKPQAPAPALTEAAMERPVDDATMTRADQASLAWLNVLGPRLSAPRTTGPMGRDRSPYVLPGAEWWVAVEVGRHDVDRTWAGTDDALVEALNGTEVPHPTWSAGALFGRTWRSGLGVSVGAAYEGSRYEFDHLEQQLPIDSVIEYTYLVTLDTQVFVSTPATTVIYGEPTETRVTGSNSLGILQLPVELYWHTPVKRWSFGGRIGLMTELTLVRRGYTLVNDQELGLLSAPCNEERFDSRYGPALTGIVGADLGYTLTEHWGLWLSPSYMRGLTAFGTTDQPWSLAERFSLRMRLSYSFIR